MKHIILPALAVLALSGPAMAQDGADWSFGGDAYMAGRAVTLSQSLDGDFFGAGDRVSATGDVGGSAHMAGRYVSVTGEVAGNLYAAGMTVDVDGPVSGNVTAMGETVTLTEPVSGNLRATGSNVTLAGPVAGSAILAGEHVSLSNTVVGDLAISAQGVDWGSDAMVRGTVYVYADDPDAISVPESVASADRVEYHDTSTFAATEVTPVAGPSVFSWLRGFVGGVLVIGLLATALAALAPDYTAALRRRALDNPLRTGWIGFLGMSALIGSVVLLAMTGIGAILIPVSLIAAAALGVLGYVVGAYVVGVWATGLAGRVPPVTTADRAIAAFAGAAILAVLGLVPFLGWLFAMAVFLIGAGAVVIRWFSPHFMGPRTS